MSAAPLLPIQTPARPPSLWDLEDSLSALLETGEGGVPEEVRDEYTRALAEAFHDARQKRDGVARFLRHLDHQIELGESEKARLTQRIAKLAQAKESLSGYVRAAMDRLGIRKLEGDLFTLSLRKNPDRVQVLNETDVPREFLRWVPPIDGYWVPDKKAIAQALKDHQLIGGCDLLRGEDRLEVK